jgi:CO/xanthine dehydrogenase FAD-binding subunit
VRTAISALTLKRPRNLAHALAMMRDAGPLTPLAGCTDIYVNLQFGTARETRYIDVWPLEELRGISADKHMLRIGGLNTYSEIIASRLVREWLPMLVAAAREIGGRQIQNRGTLAGNIANASPAGDSLPVLAAADATVVLVSADNERRVPLTSFYTGYRKTVRRDDELILAIDIPRVEGQQWWRKVGTRRAQAISKVMMAGVKPRNRRVLGRGTGQVRIAVGSVAPTVLRLRKTEQALTAGASLSDALHVLSEEITPIDDIRSTADYRRRVTANLLTQFWEAG